MKKPLLIIFTGLLLAAGAYGGLFLARTADHRADAPSEIRYNSPHISSKVLPISHIREK